MAEPTLSSSQGASAFVLPGTGKSRCEEEFGGSITAEALPTECLVLVFSHLDCWTRSLCAAQVCLRWRAIATDSTFLSGSLGRERGFNVPTTACSPISLDYFSSLVPSNIPLYKEAAWRNGSVRRLMCAALFDHAPCLIEALHSLQAIELGQLGKRNIIELAIRSGGTACVRHLIEREEWPLEASWLMESAVKQFNSDAIKWLKTVPQAPRLSQSLVFTALAGLVNNPKNPQQEEQRMISFFDQIDDAYMCPSLYCLAATRGRLDVIRALHRRGVPLDPYATLSAAEAGHLECMRYAHENGAPWHLWVLWKLIQRGDLPGLQYAIEKGATFAHDTIRGVMYLWSGGKRRHDIAECLISAVKHGCPKPEFALEQAARFGDLDLMRRLYEILGEGCRWPANACTLAARGGWNGCLYFAHQHGAPWDSHVWAAAAARGNIKMLAYALCHGCPCNVEAALAAAKHGGQKWCVEFIERALDLGLIRT